MKYWAYFSYGQKTTVIDGNENKYQYNYDEYGRLVNETNRLEDSQYYFYDAEGNLETKKDFAYEYDAKKSNCLTNDWTFNTTQLSTGVIR